MSANFVSLHNHTEYSFLDGAIKIGDLVKRAVEFKMPALAITDHGGLFGAVEFFDACNEAKIKPIIGFEAYVTPGSRLDKTPSNDKRSHLILLASNEIGWKNLMRLSTIGYVEGFYSKPRIDIESLRKYSEGIIATSACVAGAIPRAIGRGDMEGARKIAEEYIDIFGDGNFYFELQDHGLDEEKIAMKGLMELGREMGVPFIVANDAHYLRREDAKSHEVLLCIQTRSKMDDPNRYKFSSEEVYFKSPDEMAKLFPDIPEAMSNTLEIAERCSVNIRKKVQLPSVEVPEGFESPEDYLSRLAREGLGKIYADVTPELEERLATELKTINGMGFAGYFLIVRDFVLKAREMGIMVGCRGSAAGCLVAYAIGITNVDPIKYDLLFERFLNPERISMPDADIDFADRDRHKIIEYVIDKYGRDSVCQIITFGAMKAKSVVKDVARVMGVSVGEANRLSKMITEETLDKSLSVNSDLAKEISDNEQYRELFRHARVLEGLKRQPSMHPAGVIIAPGEAADWAPLFKPSDSNEIMTQFDMSCVESVGLVKMDFLGLITQTALQEAVRLIKKYHGKELDLWKLPENDEKVFELFGKGDTAGMFQFESSGMREYLRKLKPTCIEDLIAMNALYRPGPMNFISMFINRKHGKEEIEYLHPLLENILNVTYGVIVYQEQVMRIAQMMGGFSLGQADILRRAMGKKDAEKMEKMGGKFMEGAAQKGIDKKTARAVFDLMAKFAEYGFNKSHSTVYAHLAYQTAYLKVHYPLEYVTAYLAAYLEKPEEFLKMRNEAERLGIRMLPPDINKSEYEFSIEGSSIRIGLGAVKNVGKAADIIIKAREEKGNFTSIFDVCGRTDNRVVNKKALESLVYAGAFDGFEGTRAQHAAAVDKALEYGKSVQAEQASGQFNLFEGLSASAVSAPEPKLPQVAPWPLTERLQKEKDILGFYASGHPLDSFQDEIRGFSDVDLASKESVGAVKDGSQVTIGGLITSFKPHTIQKGKQAGRQMGFLELETFDASIELIAFADVYEKHSDLLTPDSMILVRGKLEKRDEENPKLHVENCIPLASARDTVTRSVHIKIDAAGLEEKDVRDIYDCCIAHPGDRKLIIHAEADGSRYDIKSKGVCVSPTPELMSALRAALGKENVWLAKTDC